MRKLHCFTFLSLDGYYKDENEGISWHQHDEDATRFSEEQTKDDRVLVFGRATYEMMYGFWTSPEAFEYFPNVARRMNEMEKIVFSNTLEYAGWQNTRVLSGDVIREFEKLKESEGNDLIILGSGNLVAALSNAGLIDQYELLIDPVLLGNGTRLFDGNGIFQDLKLVESRTFKSGAVVLIYTASADL